MIIRRAWRICGWCTVQTARIALWSTWLALLLLLAAQIHYLSSRHIPIPAPLFKRVQNHLAAQGLRLDYGRGEMDFAGRFMLENVRLGPLSDPGFDFASAHTAYLRLDLWKLLVGRVAIRDARVDGLESESLVSGLDLAFSFEDRTLNLSYLSGYIGPVPFVADGLLRFPPLPEGAVPADNPGDRLARAWPALLARAAEIDSWLSAADTPSLRLNFLGREIALDVSASRIDLAALPGNRTGSVEGLRLHTVVPATLQPFPETVSGEIAKLVLPENSSASGLVFALSASPDLQTAALDLQLADARWSEIETGPLAATFRRGPSGEMTADVSAFLARGAWRARASLADARARLTLDGFVSDATLAFAGGLINRDLADLLDPVQAAPLHVEADFARGFRLEKASGTLHSGFVRVGAVHLDETGAEFSYDGSRVLCDALVLRQGDSLAKGSYEMDTRTLDFRFLLTGTLRPMGISGWFHDWWSNFWNDFDFTRSLPLADVDVQGRWGDLTATRVFVLADGGPTGLKGVPFDRVATRLFLRPQWFDILHFSVGRPDGDAGGRISRTLVHDSAAWTGMEFSVASTLPLSVITSLFPAESAELLAPYAFDRPPALDLSGRVSSASSTVGKHEYIDVALRSKGPMTYHGFPLSDLAFKAAIRDNDIGLPELSVTFAGGRATGGARLWDASGRRRLAFDITLSDADLAAVVQAVTQLQPASPPASPKAADAARLRQQRLEGGRLDFSLKAEGLFADFHSFNGEGRGSISEAELGQLNLFGPVSAALHGSGINFGSFSLTTVEAPFALRGDRLRFEDLRVSGPSALILAKGRYALRDGALDFTARMFPFDENPSLFGSAVSFVLNPLSKIFEVRLAGTLSAPEWIFSYGPSRLYNSIIGNNSGSSLPTPTPAPSPAAP